MREWASDPVGAHAKESEGRAVPVPAETHRAAVADSKLLEQVLRTSLGRQNRGALHT